MKELLAVAHNMAGQLTVNIHGEPRNLDETRELVLRAGDARQPALPPELQAANPLDIRQHVDGKLEAT